MAYKKKEKIALMLYYDYKDQFEELTDQQLRQLIYAMIEFDKNDRVIELDQVVKMAFIPIKRRLKLDKEEWIAKCNINSENGKKSHKKNDLATVNGRQQTLTDLTEKEKEKEKEKDKDRECENKFSHIGDFVAPTLADILSYSQSLDFADEEYCEKFYNHYESVGWVNGMGQQIKNWKLIFNNWLKEDKKENGMQIDTSRRLG